MIGSDNLYVHRLTGPCKCGIVHGTYMAPAPPRKPPTDTNRIAMDIWRASIPIEGTMAHKYLESRGITVDLPDSLRYHGSLMDMDTQAAWPALVAAIAVWPSKEVVAIQRTYLTVDEAGQVSKAPISSPRQRLGSARGGAIRLADPGRQLLIGEGLEDVLSVTQHTGLPGWAVMGTGNLARVLIPETVTELVIAADSDKDGLNAAYAAASYWSSTGRAVKVVAPEDAKDWNEHLLAGVA
jgi:hypothetical protein